MERLDKQLFALFATTLTATTSAFDGLEREPLGRSPVDNPAQIAVWGNGRISDAVWSPNGDLFAVGSALGVALHNMQSHNQLYQLPTTTPTQQIAFLGDGDLLAIASDDAMRLWHIHDSSLIQMVLKHDQTPVSMAFSADAELVAVDIGDAINIHWVRDGMLLCKLHTDSVGVQGCMAFSPDSKLLAVATGGMVQFWQLDQGKQIGTLDESADLVSSLVFATDGQTLITASDRAIELWNVSDSTRLRTLTSDLTGIRQITISHDGRILAAAADTGIHLWRTEDGLPLRVLPAQPERTVSLAFDPASQNLMAAASDGLLIWQIQDGEKIYDLSGHWDSISGVAVASDGRTFAAMAEEVMLWRIHNGDTRFLHDFPIRRRISQASGIAFSPNGDLIALATDTHTQLRRVHTGALQASLKGGVAQADGLVFSSNGKNLITVSLDAVRIWRVRDGVLLHILSTCTANAYTVAHAPDGETLATVTDQTIQIWSLPDVTLLSSRHVTLDVNGVALASGGRMLAIASDKVIQIWRGDAVGQGYTIESGAQRMVFSANGEFLASTWDSEIQIWRTRNGALLHSFTGHTDIVNSIAFAHDGHTLISGAHDGTIRLWECQP